MQLSESSVGGDANLNAYYKFESGALTTDSSASSHTLSAISDPAETSGRFGGGVVFDSNDAYSASDHADFKITGNLSVVAWVSTTDTGEGGIIQSFSATPWAGWRMLRDGSNNPTFTVGDDTGGIEGTNYEVARGTTDITDGQWYHVAGVYDGSYVYMYVNGVEEAKESWSNDPAYDGTNNYVRVGCLNNSGSNISFLTGSVDDVAVFDRVLTPAEISELAAIPLGGVILI